MASPPGKRTNQQAMSMQNAEELLTDIMEDLDFILEDWKNEKHQGYENPLATISQGTSALSRDDSAWFKEVLGKH